MSEVKCCNKNCGKVIYPEKTGCYNTPIGVYCIDCYENNGGKEKVTKYYKRQPAFSFKSIKI